VAPDPNRRDHIVTDEPDVLVVGGGPTGLSLALQLVAWGVRVRVIDRRDEAFRPSRAMVVQPRTLEVLHPVGVGSALVDRGEQGARAVLHVGTREIDVGLSDTGIADSPYPRLLFIRQAEVESVLRDELIRRGVAVEWGHELADIAQDPAVARATVSGPEGSTEVRAHYIAGCDGAASTVRRCAGIPYDGGAYRESVLMADVEVDGGLSGSQAHAFVGEHGILFLFTGGELAGWRLIAARSTGEGGTLSAPERDDVQRLADRLTDGRVALSDVAWAEDVAMQHRLARRFRHGRVFLCGDAAHVHSPAAAQGMNTGIQDACNLGWKLALAAKGAAGAEELLTSYEDERRPVARRGILLTSLAFWGEAADSLPIRIVRGPVAGLLAPLVLPVALGHPRLLAPFLRLLMGLRWHYRHSALSQEGVPSTDIGPRPGDRMPDSVLEQDGRQLRLHDATARPAMHLLLYGGPSDWPTAHALRAHATELQSLRISGRGVGQVLVRPDGYVAYRAGGTDLTDVLELVSRWLPAGSGR
jgi:2-polyprenyl-6-methoxyphenol hydroxylase-like FAD-dependent oxidoreductase